MGALTHTRQSTRDAIESLYPRIPSGGFVIIDDWHLEGCRKAIMEYRAIHAIKEDIVAVYGPERSEPFEVFWRVGQPIETS